MAKIDSGAGTGVIGEETGINRNVKGEGPFHDMSVRCLYHWSVALLALFGHPPALRNVRYRGGKADMTRTGVMSANDPKRTSVTYAPGADRARALNFRGLH